MNLEEWDYANAFIRVITKEEIELYPNIIQDVLWLIKLKLSYETYKNERIYKVNEMNELLTSYRQELPSYITIHEFYEKYVPCWDTVRYNLSPSEIANKLKPFLLKDTTLWVEKKGVGYVYPLKILKSAYKEYKETFIPYNSFRKGFKGITSGAPKNKPIEYFNNTWPSLNEKFHSYDKYRQPLPEITKLDFKVQELLKDYICCRSPKITVYNDSWFYNALHSQSISEEFTVQWFDLNFHETYRDSNIIWSTNNFISLWEIYCLYVESPINNSFIQKSTMNNDFINAVRTYTDLVYYRPSITKEGMLTFDLYISRILAKTLCQSFGIDFSLKCAGECGDCTCCKNSSATKTKESKIKGREIAKLNDIEKASEKVKVFKLFGFEIETKLRKKELPKSLKTDLIEF